MRLRIIHVDLMAEVGEDNNKNGENVNNFSTYIITVTVYCHEAFKTGKDGTSCHTMIDILISQ